MEKEGKVEKAEAEAEGEVGRIGGLGGKKKLKILQLYVMS